MKVLMTADTLGGVWTYAMELAEALGRHGMHVVLASMGRKPTPDQQWQASRIGNLELLPSEFKLEWMPDPWDDVDEAGDWLLSLSKDLQADVIHLNSYAHAGLAWPAPVLVTAHSCVVSWWQSVHGCAPPCEWNEYRRSVATGLAAADAVVAPSYAMLESLQRNYGPVPRCRVIPNGRCAERFSPGPKHPFVFAAGRLWDKAKNLAALDSAAANLPWPVYVAGPLENPAQRMNVEAVNVRVLGVLGPQELKCWLRDADIYALPARYEPFGLSVLEAALVGCALVLGDIPSLRENWHDVAVFVPPDEPCAIHEAIDDLIRSPVLRRKLALQSRQRALEFGPDVMAERYCELYTQLRNARRHGDMEIAPILTQAG